MIEINCGGNVFGTISAATKSLGNDRIRVTLRIQFPTGLHITQHDIYFGMEALQILIGMAICIPYGQRMARFWPPSHRFSPPRKMRLPSSIRNSHRDIPTSKAKIMINGTTAANCPFDLHKRHKFLLISTSECGPLRSHLVSSALSSFVRVVLSVPKNFRRVGTISNGFP
jgi:hypothetical protein